MIGSMPASSEHAPRSRPAPWLLAGAIVLSIGSMLVLVAWFAVPWLMPGWVFRNSPWIAPVVRASLCQEVKYPGTGALIIVGWIKNDPRRRFVFGDYLKSPDLATRRQVVSGLTTLWLFQVAQRPMDVPLLPLLDDPDPVIRKEVAECLKETRFIPALEAHQHDPDAKVANAIAQTLAELRASAATP